ncbi:hypothetical protein LOAG_03464 [Loa loa]|uniref:Uncharacterized protein n=1 Tax=Loa loa TaxID=7209 RepID=A0A1S0U4N8_LOALO|nr:hypothetical protein LOAG_03464 [Loa loa]EFO25021.2 hypothetical protein LOAG_03464 [Loa loa]
MWVNMNTICAAAEWASIGRYINREPVTVVWKRKQRNGQTLLACATLTLLALLHVPLPLNFSSDDSFSKTTRMGKDI